MLQKEGGRSTTLRGQNTGGIPHPRSTQTTTQSGHKTTHREQALYISRGVVAAAHPPSRFPLARPPHSAVANGSGVIRLVSACIPLPPSPILLGKYRAAAVAYRAGWVCVGVSGMLGYSKDPATLGGVCWPILLALVVAVVTGFLWWCRMFGKCSTRGLCAVLIVLSIPNYAGIGCPVRVGRRGFGRSLCAPFARHGQHVDLALPCFDGVDHWLVGVGVVGKCCDAVSLGLALLCCFGDAFDLPLGEADWCERFAGVGLGCCPDCGGVGCFVLWVVACDCSGWGFECPRVQCCCDRGFCCFAADLVGGG